MRKLAVSYVLALAIGLLTYNQLLAQSSCQDRCSDAFDNCGASASSMITSGTRDTAKCMSLQNSCQQQENEKLRYRQIPDYARCMQIGNDCQNEVAERGEAASAAQTQRCQQQFDACNARCNR